MDNTKFIKHQLNYQWRKLRGFYKDIKTDFNLPAGVDRIYFFHIRKTAGVAIKYAFLSHANFEDIEDAYKTWFRNPDYQLIANRKVYAGWNIPLLNNGNYFFGASHEPSHFLNLPQNTYTICCFREPAKRVISQYNQIMGLIKGKVDHPMLKHASHWVEKDFKTFVDRLPANILNNQVYMFSAKLDVKEALANLKQVNFILHTESLNEDLARLSKELKLDLPLHRANPSKHKEEISLDDLNYLKVKLIKEYQFYNKLKDKTKEL